MLALGCCCAAAACALDEATLAGVGVALRSIVLNEGDRLPSAPSLSSEGKVAHQTVFCIVNRLHSDHSLFPSFQDMIATRQSVGQ